MPAAYSKDLRQRVVNAIVHQKLTQPQVAKLFGLSTASIKRYLKLFREDKDLAAKDYKRGAKPAITDEMLPELADFVQKEHQDSTIMEISEAYSKEIGCTEFKKDIMHRALKRAGLTYKKKFQGCRSFK